MMRKVRIVRLAALMLALLLCAACLAACGGEKQPEAGTPSLPQVEADPLPNVPASPAQAQSSELPNPANLFPQFKQSLDAGSSDANFDAYVYTCGLFDGNNLPLASFYLSTLRAGGFAVEKTDAAFPKGNPVIALAVEAASEEDAGFCAAILEALAGGGFAQNNLYSSLVTILEGVVNS